LLRYLLTFLVFSSPALAQSVDLRNLPDDFSFVSQGSESRVTLRFIRRDDDQFLFEETAVYSDGTSDTVKVWVNAQSQTTAWGPTGTETRFTPHDCAPSEGTCYHTWHHPDDTFEMKTETYVKDGVWVSVEYFRDGDSWAFWERDCTTYDEFGFWIDYVWIGSDGTTDAGARVQAGENRLDELRRVCQPPLLSS